MKRLTCCGLILIAAALLTPPAIAQVSVGGPPVLVGDQHRPFMRGDANADAGFDIGDIIMVLNFLFPAPGPGTTPPLIACLDAADINDDENVDVADGVFGLNHLFSFGPAPAAPFQVCGDDPTDRFALSCNSYPPCAGSTDADLAGHVLRRIAYGPTPAHLEYVQNIGAEAYIDEQLNPELIDQSGNTILNDLVAALNPSVTRNDLYELHFVRGLYSETQLLEQLNDFWNVHFNTYYWTLRNHFWFELNGVYNNSQAQVVATELEYNESEAFRELALGSFEDLLFASATSPAMIIYLDSDNNVVGSANENYAREVMELSTLGVDVVYEQSDIVEVARCFTGWTIRKKAPADYGDPHAPALADDDPTGVWSFHFEPNDHDYDAKVIFAGDPVHEFNIPAGDPIGDPEGGINDGYTVLTYLASMPETAEFITSKLIKKFVSDDVPPALQAAAIGTWLGTNGDMRAVLDTILTSDQFLGDQYRWDKIETPMESIISTVRGFAGATDSTVVRNALGDLRHLPHNFSTPDGFPEVDSLGTHKLLYRIQFAARAYTNNDPAYDFTGLLVDGGVTLDDAEAIVDHFIYLLYQGNVTAIDRQLAIDFVSTEVDGVTPADLTTLVGNATAYEDHLSLLAAFLLSYPQATQQ